MLWCPRAVLRAATPRRSEATVLGDPRVREPIAQVARETNGEPVAGLKAAIVATNDVLVSVSRSDWMPATCDARERIDGLLNEGWALGPAPALAGGTLVL